MKSRTQWTVFAGSVLLAGSAALAADAPRAASDSKRAASRIVHVQDDATAGDTTAAPRNDQTTQVQGARSRRLRFHRDTCGEPGLAASLGNLLGITQLDQSCGVE